jgi:hypothetical protein
MSVNPREGEVAAPDAIVNALVPVVYRSMVVAPVADAP